MGKRSPLLLMASMLVGGGFLSAPAQADVPNVLVTIKPLHGLVSALMAGVGEPALLVQGAASPHTYQMRPSDAQKLQQAKLIVWVGESYETFLVKPLQSLAAEAHKLELQESKGVALLPTREGGVWDAHPHDEKADHDEPSHDKHDHDHDHDHDHGDHGHVDGHLWLSPANAKAITQAVATQLVAMDVANAERYQSNASALLSRIDALDAELIKQLTPVHHSSIMACTPQVQSLSAPTGSPAPSA